MPSGSRSVPTPVPLRALVFGRLYRHGGEWTFRAVGQGCAPGLAGLAAGFGVSG
jgi:hypothetical protein